MVMSSQQIAQMNGSFQGTAMNQMAYSSMITQQSPYSGERMAGSQMNTVGALASPIAMGGLALAGMDPLSMGLKFGAAGFSAGGIAGAAGGAALGAGLVGAPLMAASYAGGQFMQGAQQHQQLGGQLRSGFGFRNQSGGSGFQGAEVGQIGSMMRQMTNQQGAGGEMVNFDELGRLASNMGRMGMSQGVRNAKEFTEKFKSMVTALKEIATEMGTSLEEAQKMMAGMKQSGVFGTGQQVQFAKMIRSGAQAGGMATTEVTGMMGVGSQISRMVGGRGMAGAKAGIETITNIGVAQQMGTINEEDVYNATGLTGAEGRRQLATNQLQGAAQFLKGGLGRRMLAAMAGKDGKLDQADADEFKAGGVGVDRTRKMWQENMKGVGRANFIRNEGRLRGEALSQFGGLAPAIAMRGWMEGKGIDVNVDNDRAMLFLQRRLHMGRDEADVMMKQVRDLPQLMRERKVVGKEEDAANRMRTRDATTGVAGLKLKLDKAASSVRKEFQEAGAGFMENLSNEYEALVNELTGTRLQQFRKDAVRALDEAGRGGATGKAAMSQTFGVGGGMADNMRGLGKSVVGEGGRSGRGSSIMNGLQMAAVGAGALVGGAAGAAVGGGAFAALRNAITPGTDFMSEFNRSDKERLGKAGYSFEGITTQRGVTARLNEVNKFASAAAGRGVDIDITKTDKTKLNDLYSSVKGMGQDRAVNLEAKLLASDDPKAKALGEQLRGATTAVEKGRIIAGINRALGRPDEGRLYAVGDMQGVYNTSDHLTYKDAASAIGESLLGTTGERRTLLATGEQNRKMYSVLDSMLHKVGLADKEKALFAKDISEEAVAATGAFARTDEGRRLAAQGISDDAGSRAAVTEELQSNIAALEAKQAEAVAGGGDLSEGEKGTMEYMRSVRAAQVLQDAGGANASPEAIKKAAESLNMTPEQLHSRASGIVGLVGNAQREARATLEGGESRERMHQMSEGGLIDKDGKLNKKMSALQASKGEKGKASSDFLNAMIAQETSLSELTSATSDEDRQEILSKVYGTKDKGGLVDDKLAAMRNMSVKQMRELAGELEGSGASESRSELLGKAGRREKLEKGTKGGGKDRGVRNLVGQLGVDMGRKEITKLLEGEGGEEKLAGTLMERMGLKGDAAKKDILGAVKAMRSGDSGSAEEKMSAVLGGSENVAARQKQSLKQGEAKDPVGAEGNKFLKRIEELLIQQNRMTGRIVNNTLKDDKDPE